MNKENITTEFKREYTDDIKKTIIAFANTSGGQLFIGVDDNGTAVGVDDADETALKVTNAVRDSVRPDVTLFMLCEKRELDGKSIVCITVQKGTSCPYYLYTKGIRPEGVFVRQGASTVPATESAILKMIKETSGDDYEMRRSLLQNLTFNDAKTYFADENISFNNAQKRTLGIIGSDEAYTNLGLLLSDQCVHTAKLAIFEGSVKTVFTDRCEFGGSLLKQAEDIYSYLERFNRTRAEFSGLKRNDIRDYPPEAVREALLNALVHRDYSYSGATLISVFDDRMEFLTLGGLTKGISINDVMMGVSLPRNNRLANIFYRLHLIEAFGTGIPKIMECYRNYEQQPKIEPSDNAFKITLPNTNFSYQNTIAECVYVLTEGEEKVYEYLCTRKASSRSEIEKAMGVTQSMALRLLNRLIDKKLIVKNGNGRNIRYSAINKG